MPSRIHFAERLAQLHSEESPEAAFIWIEVCCVARMESVHDADDMAIGEA